jgi:hypothetical protein
MVALGGQMKKTLRLKQWARHRNFAYTGEESEAFPPCEFFWERQSPRTYHRMTGDWHGQPVDLGYFVCETMRQTGGGSPQRATHWIPYLYLSETPAGPGPVSIDPADGIPPRARPIEGTRIEIGPPNFQAVFTVRAPSVEVAQAVLTEARISLHLTRQDLAVHCAESGLLVLSRGERQCTPEQFEKMLEFARKWLEKAAVH